MRFIDGGVTPSCSLSAPIVSGSCWSRKPSAAICASLTRGVGLLLAESPGETEHALAYIGSKLGVGDGAADGWSGVSGVCHRSLA